MIDLRDEPCTQIVICSCSRLPNCSKPPAELTQADVGVRIESSLQASNFISCSHLSFVIPRKPFLPLFPFVQLFASRQALPDLCMALSDFSRNDYAPACTLVVLMGAPQTLLPFSSVPFSFYASVLARLVHVPKRITYTSPHPTRIKT